MYQYVKTWLEIKTDKRAVTALEYGLIAATVVGIGVLGFTPLMTNMSAKFNSVATKLT